jgi:hypothetical protein
MGMEEDDSQKSNARIVQFISVMYQNSKSEVY